MHAVDYFIVVLKRNALAHMRNDLIRHQQHGRAVHFRKVERLYGQLIHFLNGAGGKGYHGMVAVRTPAGLHHVALCGGGGKAGGGACAHYHGNNYGQFRHGSVTYKLLLKGEARAAGGSHCLFAGQACAANGRYGSDLVLHLKELAAYFGEQYAGLLGYFRGRGYGVTRKKTHARLYCAHNAGFIALQQNCLAHLSPSLITLIAKSGQRSSHI